MPELYTGTIYIFFFIGKAFYEFFICLIMHKMKSNPSDNLMGMKAKKRLKSTNEINHVDKFEKKKKFCQNEMFKVEIQILH